MKNLNFKQNLDVQLRSRVMSESGKQIKVSKEGKERDRTIPRCLWLLWMNKTRLVPWKEHLLLLMEMTRWLLPQVKLRLPTHQTASFHGTERLLHCCQYVKTALLCWVWWVVFKHHVLSEIIAKNSCECWKERMCLFVKMVWHTVDEQEPSRRAKDVGYALDLVPTSLPLYQNIYLQ